jgi:hypothetical protein
MGLLIRAPSRSGTTKTARDRSWWWGLVSTALGTLLLCWPFLGAIASFGDEGILLHGAVRILQGERLYIDLFEFIAPGGFVLTAAWLAATGGSFFAARSLVLLLLLGIACLTYAACWRACRSATAAAALVLVWALMSQGMWTALSHHWPTTFFSMIVVWALLERAEEPSRAWPLVILAGLAGGCAAMVTQSRGGVIVLAGLVAFLSGERRLGQAAAYLAAAAAVPAALGVWLIAEGSLGAAFEAVVLYPIARYADMQSLPYGAFADMQNLLLGVIYPLAGLLAAAHATTRWREAKRDDALHLCTAFAAAGAVGFAVRPGMVQIAFAIPLALPLLLHAARRLDLGIIFRPAPVMVALYVILLLPAVALYALRAGHVLSKAVVETPRGPVRLWALEEESRPMVERVTALPPGDAVFFYPWNPLFAFISGRLHPGPVDVFIPEQTSTELYHKSCLAALREAAWLVRDRRWTTEEFHVIHPAMRDPAPPERRSMEQVLEDAFVVVAVEGQYELRQRRSDIRESRCNRILDGS